MSILFKISKNKLQRKNQFKYNQKLNELKYGILNYKFNNLNKLYYIIL